jgi:Immunity protein 35
MAWFPDSDDGKNLHRRIAWAILWVTVLFRSMSGSMAETTFDQAVRIATGKLAAEPEYHFVILPDKTEEHTFGWVFYYVPRRFQETGDFSYLVPGTGPLIVNRDGSSLFATSSVTPKLAVEEYERSWLRIHSNQRDIHSH